MESVRTFILALDRARRSKDRAALAGLVRFPIRIDRLEYGLDIHVRARTIQDPAAALEVQDEWAMPPGFVTVARKQVPMRGLVDCNADAKGEPRATDFSKGGSAIDIKGQSASITVEPRRCGAGMATDTWQLERTPGHDWILVRHSLTPA
ncbi:hypothetical protein [Pendulispora albinea]|uniref:Uncharacterized protein n=1 Tax=Pendulispora albinea TaxID=2741071 RepID=A0ABZ2LMN2_9BACT